MYTNYDIFDDMLGLRNTIDGYFSNLAPRERAIDYPHINLYEKDNAITIHALMPGVANDAISIQLVDNSLIIEGERKPDYADKPYIRRERSFGKFKKSIRLPYAVNRETVTAARRDGVLIITLQKSPEALPRKIEIK
ncbi:MAG TPA: Hsp20/alpha crystallin family protein [Spirochaetota bacterium]|nr:Hsp20/alpha crystallin family protein [Spirochaetota bacterium]HPI22405.1 Hsp20/alpha crystallin family protein [Spirochaetota bacterium]HPU88566.1 Hsp20/alpha crystallin family protein [Spirochaetota bacterium]